MNETVLEVFKDYWHILIIGSLLFSISVGFIIKFILPACRLRKDLENTLAALRQINARSGGAVVELDEVAKEAMATEGLTHLWQEYTETLHPQKAIDALGQIKIVRWRATALAESFFTEQALVDTPLKTEFYKHLPGILTGLGIIGTFSGLILGLTKFDVSVDPAQAQTQLQELINSVGNAFIVSATAIALAMIFTWIEKSVVTARYKQVEGLCQLIDSFFHAGASEEYLERLVKASETSATQAAQIKDALVADLKQILSDLTTQQMEASARHTGQISVDVGKAIAESLGGPMEKISVAVDRVGANQGDAVNKMLTDVLVGFSAKIEEMFGGQLKGMGDLLDQTSRAMLSTAVKFEQLSANMDTAGKNVAEAMGERLKEAITSMEVRQEVLNRQMAEFVEQIRSMVTESQSQSSLKLQETLSKLGEQVATVVGQLQAQVKATADSQQEQSDRVAKQAGDAVLSISEQVEKLMAQSLETSRSLQASVISLSKATNDAITGLNTGAETLYVAASDFAKAGQGVAETMMASSTATQKIEIAAQTLFTAITATQQILQDYSKTRDVFSLMVSELKLTIESAKKEASLTTDVVSKLEAASTQLGVAQKQSEEYLKGVSEVLTKSHETFAESIGLTLRKGNAQFQKELEQAVSLLSGAIKDLGDTLDDLPGKR